MLSVGTVDTLRVCPKPASRSRTNGNLVGDFTLVVAIQSGIGLGDIVVYVSIPVNISPKGLHESHKVVELCAFGNSMTRTMSERTSYHVPFVTVVSLEVEVDKARVTKISNSKCFRDMFVYILMRVLVD